MAQNVSKITGLEAFGIDPAKFAHEMQKRLASSTTVSPLPGKSASGDEVLIQGNMASELIDVLTSPSSVYGLPRRFVEVNDKTK